MNLKALIARRKLLLQNLINHKEEIKKTSKLILDLEDLIDIEHKRIRAGMDQEKVK